jgi:RecB family exonuclease
MILSHSSISIFESCPRRFRAEKIDKTAPKPEPSPEVVYGINVHESLEVALKSGSAPTGAGAPYSEWLEVFPEGATSSEVELAINKDGAAAEWESEDTYFRGVADVVIDTDEMVSVFDFKTGKRRSGFTQVDGYVALLSAHYPGKPIQGGYIWLKDGIAEVREYDEDAIEVALSDTLARADRVHAAMADKEFDWFPSPSGLCKFCTVYACEYNRAAIG